jgi:ABC-type sulfate transport system substrate-binding protein
VLQKRSKLPRVKKAWTVEERLGGWEASQKKFFSQKVGVEGMHTVGHLIGLHR